MSTFTFTDALAAVSAANPPRPQKALAPRYSVGDDGVITAALTLAPGVNPHEADYRQAILDQFKVELPDDVEVKIKSLRHWGNPQAPNTYVAYDITPRAAGAATPLDVKELVALAKTHRVRKTKAPRLARTRVVIVGDVQAGKTDHRGGTEELLERLASVWDGLEAEATRDRCEDVLIVDAGDLVEMCNSTPGEQRTNSLSDPHSIELATVVMTDLVGRLAALHGGAARTATVPSNHAAWRKGKDYLGTPVDDYGLMIHRQVARVLQAAGRDVKTFGPANPHDDFVTMPLRGDAVLGLVHGHQFPRPDGFPAWLQKQALGARPIAAASILVTGHFHHLRVQPVGRYVDSTGATHDRLWIQAPTLDNGSSWFANGPGGNDSDPAAVTFTVDDHGRMDALRVINPTPAEPLAPIALTSVAGGPNPGATARKAA